MGGFFGVVSKKKDAMLDVFLGTDYHSHLGTRRGGMAVYGEDGFDRAIHNIENSPFRTKFENITAQMKGKVAIGCISDTDPQPLLIRSLHGIYAITIIGKINNLDELIDKTLDLRGGHFDAMTSGRINQTELVAALISQQENIVDGIKYAQAVIEGTCNILIMMEIGRAHV